MDGSSVMATNVNTIFARKRDPRTPRRASTATLIRLRKRTNSSTRTRTTFTIDSEYSNKELASNWGAERLRMKYSAVRPSTRDPSPKIRIRLASMPLADEPTANLDSKTSDELMELFTELNEHHNTTFIIASHDQRVMNYAKRLIRMLDGRIVDDIDQRAA